MIAASPLMQTYFDALEKECLKAQKVAIEARKKGLDPETNVEISLAKNMAERVIGIISLVAPQMRDSGADKRIIELEEKYGILDWRVAFKIAEEIAQQKFCTFSSQKEAIEVGIRTGFAYVTVGVVSSPLEGFVNMEIKNRLDGQGQYFCLNFSGPIRNAGGTAASVCVLIGDYLRKIFGYAKYDPTDKEINRCFTELEDYHNFVTNLQYFPSKEEVEFMLKNMPVEISGDPSEKYDVSNYKDLPRIPTNKLRSGYCLIHSSCIPLKAPKLWKNIAKWGKLFQMEDWNFLEEFLKIQKKAKASGGKSSEKFGPDYTYIKDLVAGRPVIGYPLRSGGLRLRYGRGRASGYSGQSVHPSTMHVLNDFFATATQLKVERPGKATSLTCCDTIEGPIVKLKNGDVLLLDTEMLAKQYKKDVQEVLYLGDVLINYGDFFNRAHVLLPPGYCEEYWIKELEESIIGLFGTIDTDKTADLADISEENISLLLKNPLKAKISARASLHIAKRFNIPMHPKYTYHWKSISKEQLIELLEWMKDMSIFQEDEHLKKIILPKHPAKRTLELIGIPHLFINQEYILLDSNHGFALLSALGIQQKIDILKSLHTLSKQESSDILVLINALSSVKIKDKSGIFIGARMGRPEKAKMRKLTGSPHVLFPVGQEGGAMRSFQTAMEKGMINSEFSLDFCSSIKEDFFTVVQRFGEERTIETESYQRQEAEKSHQYIRLNIKPYFESTLKSLNLDIFPDLIKGVRGTSNKDHAPEHLAKGILRARHNLHVNKDGTIRYDSSEVVLTHFKPKEIGVSVEKLKKLGYEKDIYGLPLRTEEQILEIRPQDVVLPACPESPDEPCDDVLLRTTQFIDDLLERFYHLPKYYNLKSKQDLIGQLIIGLAPHTSAGILGRIIGFSKTQGCMAHPFFHAAMRRDVDGDESCILLLLDGFLNFSKHYLPNSRGSTMDTPLVLTYLLNPSEVDDMAFDVDRVWNYPLSFYKACEQFKMPWDVPIEKINAVLGKPEQFEGMGFTHDTSDLNAGILCSQYKILPSMQEKLQGQMDLAVKLRCVDESDVAKLVIEKHFLRDIKGNLRKFSMQQFRCVKCNEKYRRPPLQGNCLKCGGNIIFTISEGSILKYLEPSLNMAKAFHLPTYLQQTLELTKRQIESYFGKDAERQEGLGKWFSEEKEAEV
jgi:DNA polymerase II large subunit